MKRLSIFAVLLMTSVSLSAQDAPAKEEKDVTKFLGIPVDGTKSEMIAKLKEKGFVSNEYNPDVLEGEFNGQQVEVQIQTNNDKVCRIIVVYITSFDESVIEHGFNTLCYQFKNNPKYMTPDDFDNFIIAENERIFHEILVHNKKYVADFYQHLDRTELLMGSMGADVDRNKLQRIVKDVILKRRVWFCIAKNDLGYSIVIFYENGYNMANGEDL